MKITSLAGLKRALQTPGVLIVALTHWQPQLIGTRRRPVETRPNGKPGVQTNGYYYRIEGDTREFWCALPKASELTFNPDGSVTFFPGSKKEWTLSFEGGAA